MFISHESASKSSLLNYLRTLSYLSPSLGNLIHQWFGSWGPWRKNMLLILKIVILICVFSCMSLYCCWDMCFQSRQIADEPSPNPYYWNSCSLLRAHCRRGGMEEPVMRDGVLKRSSKGGDSQLTPQLDLGNWQAPYCNSPPWHGLSIHHFYTKSYSKDKTLRD